MRGIVTVCSSGRSRCRGGMLYAQLPLGDSNGRARQLPVRRQRRVQQVRQRQRWRATRFLAWAPARARLVAARHHVLSLSSGRRAAALRRWHRAPEPEDYSEDLTLGFESSHDICYGTDIMMEHLVETPEWAAKTAAIASAVTWWTASLWRVSSTQEQIKLKASRNVRCDFLNDTIKMVLVNKFKISNKITFWLL